MPQDAISPIGPILLTVWLIIDLVFAGRKGGFFRFVLRTLVSFHAWYLILPDGESCFVPAIAWALGSSLFVGLCGLGRKNARPKKTQTPTQPPKSVFGDLSQMPKPPAAPPAKPAIPPAKPPAKPPQPKPPLRREYLVDKDGAITATLFRAEDFPGYEVVSETAEGRILCDDTGVIVTTRYRYE